MAVNSVNNSVNNVFKNQPVSLQTTSYTAAPNDVIIGYTALSAAVTVTLPTAAAANKGKFYVIKDEAGAAATNNITIQPSSGNIDGVSSIAISSNFGSVQVYTDGNAWFTQSENLTSNFSWVSVSAATVTAAFNTGYYTSFAGTTVVTLPTITAAMVGKVIEIVGTGAVSGGSSLTLPASQSIVFGDVVTTATTAALASTNAADTVRLLSISTTQFVVLDSLGNLAVT